MSFSNAITGQRYFTHDHDWVDFKGSVADVGVGKFKLTGFKAIDKIVFGDVTGFLEQGAVIATIHYNDYCVELKMPVAGKISELNSALINGELNCLLQSDHSCWIARVIPAQPYERKGLVPPKEYAMNGKSKHAKF